MMTMTTTSEKLDQLSEFQAQQAVLYPRRQEKIDAILTPDQLKQIADIEAEFATQAAAVVENIDRLTEEIKAETLAAGDTIKGTHLMAVWGKGRTTWDSKLLEGMSRLIPQLNDARKTGEPTVSFRKI